MKQKHDNQKDKQVNKKKVRRKSSSLENKAKCNARTSKKQASVSTDEKNEAKTIQPQKAPTKRKRKIKIPATGITPREIAKKIRKPEAKVISELMSLGIIASPDQLITDHDTITLIFYHFNYDVVEFEKPPQIETTEAKQAQPHVEEKEEISQTLKETSVVIQPGIHVPKEKIEVSKETLKVEPEKKKEIPPDWVKKVPVVTVMGHVDHGKTTLLDTIRNSNIASKEYGAITQHIGAYKVTTPNGDITFIDTPGHEAFSTIRSRGAKVTDIVVLVVAGDEGVMPQTIESINHAKAANVPIIVAINKIDLPHCNPHSVKQQLAEIGLVPSEWGGNTEFVEISARNKINIDKLLDTILLQAELMDLYVPINVPCEATVIETKLSEKIGFVATIIVNKGKLKIGDPFVCGYSYGKVRAMFNDRGERISELKPGEPAEVIGFEVSACAGDILKVVESEKEARKIYEELERERKMQASKTKAYKTIEDVISGRSNVLSLVIKTDTQGSLEAIQKMLGYLSEEIKNNPNLPELKIAGSSVGEITESDVLLAAASKALIIGFNVRPNTQALKRMKIEGVEVKTYRIIYELIDDIKNVLQRLEIKKEVEVFLGRARVKKIFDISKVGKVLGCVVEEGKIVRNSKVRVLRDNKIIADTKITSLKRFKDDVKEVPQGYECGICIENFQDVKENDVIECYEIKLE